MANYTGEMRAILESEAYRHHTPLGGFYFGKSKLVDGPKIQVGRGGSTHLYAALDTGQSVSCWCDVPVNGKALLQVRDIAGGVVGEAHSSGSGASEQLTVGPLTGISKGIYIVRVVNLTSDYSLADGRAYFYDIEVASA